MSIYKQKIKTGELVELPNKSVQLCCGGRKCPTVGLTNDQIIITDDHGGSVSIPIHQAQAIGVAVDELVSRTR